MALHPERLDYISICTGGGGLDLGIELAIPSARAVCLVEREAFAVAHLVSAMEAGLMAPAPVWSDARTFDGRPWRGLVDGLAGGIPCQPHSMAGRKRGQQDERDLWTDARRIIVGARPWWVLIENVSGMLSAGADEIAGAERVWRDLQRMGFAVEGGLFTAAEVGAAHERERIFILGVADANGHEWGANRREPDAGTNWWHNARRGGEGISSADVADARRAGDERSGEAGEFLRSASPSERAPSEWEWRRRAARDGGDCVADPDRKRLEGERPDAGTLGRQDARRQAGLRDRADVDDANLSQLRDQPPAGQLQVDERHARPSLFPPGPADLDGWRAVLERAPQLEPAVRRMADVMASRVDRLRLLGNGVVPLAAGYALRTLAARLAQRGSDRAAELVRMMNLQSKREAA